MEGAASKWLDSHPGTMTYFQPPLFLMLVTISFRVLGFGLLQSRLISVLLGLGTVIVTYFLSLEVSRKRIVSSIAALLLLSQPLFVQISRQTRPESAVTFFTALAVYAFVRHRKQTKSGWALLNGIAIGAAFMSHYNGIFGGIAIFFLFLIDEKPINALKSRGLRLFVLGIFIVCLPYALYVLQDYDNGFYNFLTQLSVVGKAGQFNTIREFVQAESARYQHFFHDYRFVPSSGLFLKILYLSTLVFALLRRDKMYRMLLVILGVHLVLLVYPSPNKTGLYLGVVLPYVSILVGLFLSDLGQMLKAKNPKLAIGYSTLAILLVSILVGVNGRVWLSYYDKYRDCDFHSTVTQIRRIIPEDVSSIMGRYTFWIGLDDYEYYRRGFRTLDDIVAIRPDVFIHNDYAMSLPKSADLKAQLDSYFEQHAELIGQVEGHPRLYCQVGNLRIYRLRMGQSE